VFPSRFSDLREKQKQKQTRSDAGLLLRDFNRVFTCNKGYAVAKGYGCFVVRREDDINADFVVRTQDDIVTEVV
jgi:hypothetical protein